MSDILQEMQREIQRLERQLERFQSGGYSTVEHVILQAPLKSSNFDADTFSTVGSAGNNTLMDLSAEFGTPTCIKSVDLFVQISDSAAGGTSGLYAFFYNTASATEMYGGVRTYGGGIPTVNNFTCDCNADGDIYYRFGASGSNTLTVTIYVVGYSI